MGVDTILEVRGLCVDYTGLRGAAHAVRKVDLDLKRGEFLGVVGESGCGKSTLLFAIAELLSPPAQVVGGTVRFKGTEMAQLSEGKLRAIRWREFSVVMQSAMNALNPVKRIGAQFADAMHAHGVSRGDKEFIRSRGAEVLRLVGIDPVHLSSFPHQLSGGMRQRAMIAMALLFTPELIIMDEPTSALDVVAQRSLMVQVRELQARLGFAAIFVTHDMSLVSHFSDRLAVMYAGQVAEMGPTERLFAHPLHPYSRGLLDAFPSIRGPLVPLTGIPGSPPSLSGSLSGCAFQPRCRDAVSACRSREPGLYDVDGTSVRCLAYSEGGDRDEELPRKALVDTEATIDGSRDASAGGHLARGIRSRVRASPKYASGGEPTLRAKGLSKHFRIGGAWRSHLLHAVDDVDLSIDEHEIVALVGESGSGKSTVARLLARAYRPTSGEIYFQGRRVDSLRSRAELLAYRGAVPMVFQDPYSSLNPTYRISNVLLRTLKLHRPQLGAAERQEEVDRLLEVVGLDPASVFRDKYPHELSGGQRQRVGLAQALSCRPRVILADEPVSMLDVSIRIGLLNLMARLREEENVSFLYITHDIASARYVADRLIVMYAGCIVESGCAEEVLGGPLHPYTELLLSAVPDPRAKLAISGNDVGEPPRVVDPGNGCRFRWRCPYAVELCERETPVLRGLPGGRVAACHVKAPAAPVASETSEAQSAFGVDAL